MFRGLTCLLVSGVVSLAACGDDGTSPEDDLTVEEVEFVASLIDASSSGVLDDFFDQSGGDPVDAPALAHGPVVWTRTFSRGAARATTQARSRSPGPERVFGTPRP